jgi:[ribosomal protein S5]-alanine N-acetyltransferase
VDRRPPHPPFLPVPPETTRGRVFAGDRRRFADRAAADHLAGGLSLSAFRPHPPLILRTERLLIREFMPDDWAPMLAYQRDPRYLRFYDRDEVTERQAQAIVYMFILWQGEIPRSKAQLAITLAGTGELIGNVGLRRDSGDDPTADMGYELNPLHWGRGYATEAARAMIDWGFGAWDGLRRVHAHCVAENEASARVLLKAGLRREARMRHHQFFKNRFWDVLLFGMTRGDWKASAAGPSA